MKNILIGAGCAIIAVVVGSLIVSRIQSVQQTGQTFGAAPAGTTLSSELFAGVAGVSLLNQGQNGTSTSITNTDANARFINSLSVDCQGMGSSFSDFVGAGLANLTLTVATTTTASPATVTGNPFFILNAGAISTSTSVLVIASTTAPISLGATATSSYADYWGPGVNLTFLFNATNTAACTIGVGYKQS